MRDRSGRRLNKERREKSDLELGFKIKEKHEYILNTI